jgi:glycosyltransferase involved in cell wall biosynthesis
MEARLRVAGSVAEPDYHRQVLRYIEDHQLTDRVTILGPLSSEQIKSELAQAAIFLLVSLEEGAPLCVEEAMAAGVPVVASNRCGMPFMVRDGRTGFLVDPANSHDIATRLGQLLKDDALRETMSRQSREAARDLFHPHRVALKTRAVYDQAIQSFQEKGK